LSSADLDWLEIVKNIQSFAISGTARMALTHLDPMPSATIARTEMQKIFDGIDIVSKGVRPFMESLDLFEPWFARLKRQGVLRSLEIKDVRHFCHESLALRETLKSSNTDWAQALNERLFRAEEPISAIDHILTPGGEMRSDASETLYRLFREKETLSKQIQTSLDRLVNDHQMQTYLQDKYVTTREGRWVLPIRSGSQHSVNGVHHGSSQTKQTVFIEPEVVVPINNRLRQVDVEIEDEIERLLEELSRYLATQAPAFALAKEALLEADLVLAKSQWSMLVEAQNFEFSDDEVFLVEARNPLMLALKKNPVANSVALTKDKNLLLLSGPNAGGKTVLLKTIGLAAQMARCGLPICAATGSRLPFFKNLCVSIGDSQNVQMELSTFAGHLKSSFQVLTLWFWLTKSVAPPIPKRARLWLAPLLKNLRVKKFLA
jgi:DNA mismatch repair protein MutS2